MTENKKLEFVLRIADDRLILGHRLSELCGHGPILEEDIATINTALDLMGQAQILLQYAGELEGTGRNEDKLAYSRTDVEYRNLLMVEQDNGDFAHQIARQMFYDVYDYHFTNAMKQSSDERLRGWAEKAYKEAVYHLRHSGKWFAMLGDGTDESRNRLIEAIDTYWGYTGEMFVADEVQTEMEKEGVSPKISDIYKLWQGTLEDIFKEAKLDVPDYAAFMHSGGRKGKHSEYLGHILAEMQIVSRTYPNSEW